VLTADIDQGTAACDDDLFVFTVCKFSSCFPNKKEKEKSKSALDDSEFSKRINHVEKFSLYHLHINTPFARPFSETRRCFHSHVCFIPSSLLASSSRACYKSAVGTTFHQLRLTHATKLEYALVNRVMPKT
jgi:hypothetical protein